MIESLVEIKLIDEENFLVIKETLTRIGIASKTNKTIYQSCHILHKRGKYYIVHFKELFLLDGKTNTEFTDDDIGRRNTIINLLEQWNLIDIVNKKQTETPVVPISTIKILSHKDKKDWQCLAKYSIGNKK